MKHHLIGWYRHLKRFLAAFYILNKNALLGRSFVPHPRKRLFIETTGFCNLECKFCSYPKKVRPRTVMDDKVFRRCIDQAAALGYQHIALTPTTGDVFTDRGFVERIRYIVQSPIESFQFYTNFIGADDETIACLLSMPKLTFMEISIYGHDEESFRSITGRGSAQFRRLIDNLVALERRWSDKHRDLEVVIGLRTYRSFALDGARRNDLIDVVLRLRGLGAKIGVSSTVDNWGGDVDWADARDIDMTLTDGRFLYKKRPGGLPFDSVQVAADGQVNACACRDPHGSLALGDVRATPLAEILSAGNDKWIRIIADQEAGRFHGACATCGLYRSIYDERRTRDADGAELITTEEYFALYRPIALAARGEDPSRRHA